MAENKDESNKLTSANDKFFKGIMGMKEVVKAYIEQFLRKDVLDKEKNNQINFKRLQRAERLKAEAENLEQSVKAK